MLCRWLRVWVIWSLSVLFIVIWLFVIYCWLFEIWLRLGILGWCEYYFRMMIIMLCRNIVRCFLFGVFLRVWRYVFFFMLVIFGCLGWCCGKCLFMVRSFGLVLMVVRFCIRLIRRGSGCFGLRIVFRIFIMLWFSVGFIS